MKFIEFIKENGEWIFSGIGIMVAGFAASVLYDKVLSLLRKDEANSIITITHQDNEIKIQVPDKFDQEQLEKLIREKLDELSDKN